MDGTGDFAALAGHTSFSVNKDALHNILPFLLLTPAPTLSMSLLIRCIQFSPGHKKGRVDIAVRD